MSRPMPDLRSFLASIRASGLPAGLAVAVGLLLPPPAAADSTLFKAQFVCNDRGAVFPLAGVRVDFLRLRMETTTPYLDTNPQIPPLWLVETRMRSLRTDAEGRVAVHVRGPEYNFFFRVFLQSAQGAAGGWWTSDRSQDAETETHQNDVPVQDYGTQVFGDGSTSPECAAFEGLRRAQADYDATVVGSVPVSYFNLRLNTPSRWGGPRTTSHSFYWPPRYPPGPRPGTFTSSMREYAKAAYYVRVDNSSELEGESRGLPCLRQENEARAFVQGWGEYWAGDYAPSPNCPGVAADNYTRSGNVAAALAGLDRFCTGVGRGQMAAALKWRAIYSVSQFRTALGCSGLADAVASPLRGAAGISLISQNRFARRQIGALARHGADLRAELSKAVRRARRAPCPPTPCAEALVRVALPFVLRAELGQVRQLRRTISSVATTRKLRRLGGPSGRRLQRGLAARARAFRRAVTRIGAVETRRALSAAGPILRRDRSSATRALARRLRAALRMFRAGRLPAGFVIDAPAGTRLRPGPAWVPPPPQPLPDLVVDAVGGSCGAGCEMHAVIRNAGAAEAPASRTAIAPNASFEGETLVDTPALAPGQSATVSTVCPFLTVDFSARADATSMVAEADETNNSRIHDPGTTELGCRYP